MQLSWMILFSLCVLATSRASVPVDGSATSAEKENVDLKRSLLRSGGWQRQKDRDRETGDDDDESEGIRIKSDDGDQLRRSRIKSDNAEYSNDAARTGRGRIRVLSAGSRRIDDSNLRDLHDPTLTDDDLDRFDDNNIENELNALAAGFSRDKDANVDETEDDNYEGLGFGDTKASFRSNRLDSDNDLTPEENVYIGPPWAEWIHCNVTCGVGQQSRWRRCRDDTEGVCNRVTGRHVEWRRCLGMECDQKTIEELGGGCKDQLMMSLVIGVLIGSVGSIFISAVVSCLYAWCKKPMDWQMSDICPQSCIDSCGGCGERCNECCQGCCDPGACGGPCLCCWCQPCCDPYAQQDRLYYHKQMRMNNAYMQQHNLGPETAYGVGRMPPKRPPAPLPRESVQRKPYYESVKRKPYYDEPEYAEINQYDPGSPRKKQQDKQKQNYVKFTKPAQRERYPDSFDEREGKKSRAPQQVENDYMEVLGDQVENDYMEVLDDDDHHDAIENAYMSPTLRAYESFEYLDVPPQRSR